MSPDATLAHEAGAADRNVCQSGCPFPTIQCAINSSHPADVIHIGAGTYFENPQVPNQRLTFVGAGQDLTVIDGIAVEAECVAQILNSSITRNTAACLAGEERHGPRAAPCPVMILPLPAGSTRPGTFLAAASSITTHCSSNKY
jgi:pectin methylesterase-like acyl-CoA thioesterase